MSDPTPKPKPMYRLPDDWDYQPVPVEPPRAKSRWGKWLFWALALVMAWLCRDGVRK